MNPAARIVFENNVPTRVNAEHYREFPARHISRVVGALYEHFGAGEVVVSVALDYLKESRRARKDAGLGKRFDFDKILYELVSAGRIKVLQPAA